MFSTEISECALEMCVSVSEERTTVPPKKSLNFFIPLEYYIYVVCKENTNCLRYVRPNHVLVSVFIEIYAAFTPLSTDRRVVWTLNVFSANIPLNFRRHMKTYFLIATSLVLATTSCGKETKTPPAPAPAPSSKPETPNGTNPTPIPTPTPTPTELPPPASLDEVTFKSHAVVREFPAADGVQDTGALFLVLPSKGTITFGKMTGPAFLAGSKSTGTLDENSVQKLFQKSKVAWSDAERNSVLALYAGASYIYFENYAGNLCALREYAISPQAEILGAPVSFQFVFQMAPSSASDCKIYSWVFLASH